MARIHELLARGVTTSFEFFPPKTDEGEARLRHALGELESLEPSYVSVTYGAGGSTRERTHRLVLDLLEHTSLNPMAHLTSVAHTATQLRELLTSYRDAGVENILALRGDPPRDDPDAGFWELPLAVDLAQLAKEVGGEQFSVGVAAHPEGHPLARSLEEDRRNLAAKLEVADFAVTQFFFRADDYLRMMDDLDRMGCAKPVVAGVMPVTDVRQIQRFAELSGAAFPAELADRLLAVEDDHAEVRRIGVEVATQMCQQLLEAGAPGLHFYTLNRSTATREIHANLDLPTDLVAG